MLSGYVANQIRRGTRNLLIANLITFAVAVAIPLCGLNYLYNCFFGPFPITSADVAKIPDASSLRESYVTLSIDITKVDPSRYYMAHDNIKDYYYFLHLSSDQLLMMRTADENPPAKITGGISSIYGDSAEIVALAKKDNIEGSIANFYLDGLPYKQGMYMIVVTSSLLAAIALWNFTKVVRRYRDPLAHPISKQLAKIGPVEEMAVAIDSEVQAGIDHVGKVITTTSWLIRPGTYSADFVYLGDIAWAFKQETAHKSYGITTHKSYATIIHDTHGRQITFQLKQKQVETLVADLAARVPWAFVGFDPKLKELWKSKRADFLAAVEQRKQQYLNTPEQPPAI